MSDEFKSICDWTTADGYPCEYVGRSNISQALADEMVTRHQQLRPSGAAEINARPGREIIQHYPHFFSFDQPNMSAPANKPKLSKTISVVPEPEEKGKVVVGPGGTVTGLPAPPEDLEA